MMRRKPDPDRHASEHAVSEALDGPGCAVCALNRRAVEGWTDSLLRDGVTDVKARLRFRATNGLCGEHVRLLEQRGNPLGVGILLHDLLTEANPARQPRRAVVDCQACAFLQGTETRYLDVLATLLNQPDIQRRFAASPGLCVPHMRRLLAKRLGGAEAWTRAACAAHLEPLAAELAEIIRKHDYRFRSEEWGQEADAWRRAAALWAGACVAPDN